LLSRAVWCIRPSDPAVIQLEYENVLSPNGDKLVHSLSDCFLLHHGADCNPVLVLQCTDGRCTATGGGFLMSNNKMIAVVSGSKHLLPRLPTRVPLGHCTDIVHTSSSPLHQQYGS